MAHHCIATNAPFRYHYFDINWYIAFALKHKFRKYLPSFNWTSLVDAYNWNASDNNACAQNQSPQIQHFPKPLRVHFQYITPSLLFHVYRSTSRIFFWWLHFKLTWDSIDWIVIWVVLSDVGHPHQIWFEVLARSLAHYAL